jgi:predicted ATP-binding protein involved in virulence
MYLRKISIKQLRHISDFEMDFPSGKEAGWHVLLGENGSGKTSILRNIGLCLLKKEERNSDIAKPFLLDIIKNENNKVEAYFSENLTEHFVEKVTISAQEEKNILSFAQFTTQNKGTGFFSAAYGASRVITKEYLSTSDEPTNLDAHYSLFANFYPLTASLNWLKKLRAESLDKKVKNHENAKKLLEKIPLFLNNSSLLNGYQISEITVNEILAKDKNGNKIQLHQLADGYRAVLAMVLDILFRMSIFYDTDTFLSHLNTEKTEVTLSGVVLIDEADIHLHPTWQEQIGFQLKTHFPHIQFIVTTHSPLVCHAADSIWLLPKQGETGKVRQLSINELNQLKYGNVLDAYSSGVFGENVVRSALGNEKLKRLALLNMKALRETITEKEKEDLVSLRNVFPSTANMLYEDDSTYK